MIGGESVEIPEYSIDYISTYILAGFGGSWDWRNIKMLQCLVNLEFISTELMGKVMRSIVSVHTFVCFYFVFFSQLTFDLISVCVWIVTIARRRLVKVEVKDYG